MESSSWTNKTLANQENYATLIYFCWKHSEMLITGELQLEKKPPRRQLLTFHVKDTWLQLSPVVQLWDMAVSHRLPLTEHIIPLGVLPMLLWHPQCCEMSLAPVCQPYLPAALRLFVVLAPGAEFKVCCLGHWGEVKSTVPSLNQRVKVHLLISAEHLSYRYKLLALITYCSRILPGIHFFVWIFQ